MASIFHKDGWCSHQILSTTNSDSTEAFLTRRKEMENGRHKNGTNCQSHRTWGEERERRGVRGRRGEKREEGRGNAEGAGKKGRRQMR